ncbi:MAG TPA: hypothetical protein VGG74_02340 [Kofleriaceae bacterium]|jgi:hypothetical protein
MLSLLSLLIHDEDVPPSVRAALREASAGSAEARRDQLELAARTLHRESQLDCGEALELVGLAV